MVDYYGGHPNIPRQADVQTGAAAVSEIIAAHAGRARWLAEWVLGEKTGSEAAAPIPSHSPGAPGHDHSGGIMGTPIVRPYWSCAFGLPNSALTTSAITNGRAPQATVKTTAGTGEKAWLFNGTLKHIVIPGCPRDGVHYRARLTAEVHADVGITLYVNTRPGQANYTQSLSVGYNDVTPSDVIDLVPGVLNRIPLEIWVQGTVASNTIVTLCSLALNQVESVP